jgi:Uma2 family endonuclease
MAIEQRRMTREEFLALPEEKPALELAPDGTVTQKVAPKRRHSRLQLAIGLFVERAARGEAFAFSELTVDFGDAVYVPDVAVYRKNRIPLTQEGEIAEGTMTEPPDIAAEIASPGQSRRWLVRKCAWYVEHGVALALLIDPEQKSVLVFGPGTSTATRQGTEIIDLSAVVPDLIVSCDQLFSALRLS